MVTTTSASTCPVYSVHKLGRNRYFWLAGQMEDWLEKHMNYGYAVSQEEAARAALESCPEARPRSERLAQRYYALLGKLPPQPKRRSNPPRRKKPGLPADPPLEFVYDRWYNDEERSFKWIPYRILKRTAKRVFIDSHRYRPNTLRPADRPMFRLNRQELELNGQAVHGRYYTFYSEAGKREAELGRGGRRAAKIRPACIAALGLNWPCTLDELRSMYRRRSKELHPDLGGSHEQFLDLKKNYEAALTLLKQRPG